MDLRAEDCDSSGMIPVGQNATRRKDYRSFPVSSCQHVETLHKRTLLYCIINLSALNSFESGAEAKTGP
jgi:hypothetical protein